MIYKVILLIIGPIIAYLFSGLNPAIILSNIVYKEDIRTVGSKNPGFTNFKRVYGGALSWVVLFLDMAKGAILAIIFGLLFKSVFNDRAFGVAYIGLFAMIGHSYPIWYHFKGGKGFLVGASTIFFIDWRVGLIAFGIMCLFLFTIKFMSLATICAAISCPITLVLFNINNLENIYLVLIFCTLSVLLMIYRHKKNIVRLLKKEEPKFSFKSKSKN